MRSLIIDDILSGGYNVSTEYYPGSFRAIGSKYKISGVAVSNVWKTFCQMGEKLPRLAAARGQPKRLAEPELDLVQPLINVDLRELTWALIKENIETASGRRENDLEKDDEASRQKIHPPIIKLDTLIESKDSLDWSNASFSFNGF